MARAHWYVIQVMGGKEERARTLILAACAHVYDTGGKPILEEVFSPKYQTRRKYHGEWENVTRDLLPGYVIAVTAHPDLLRNALQNVDALTKLLMMGGEFVPLSEEERTWLDNATKPGERVVPLSIAVKVGDTIQVTEGPLKGNEAMISKINRHKCQATLEFRVGGKKISTRVGLAVLAGEKS